MRRLATDARPLLVHDDIALGRRAIEYLLAGEVSEGSGGDFAQAA